MKNYAEFLYFLGQNSTLSKVKNTNADLPH